MLESSWAKGDNALFKNRENVVDFLHLMLVHKFFHRARKVPVSEQELKGRKKEKKSPSESSDEKKKDDNEKKDQEKAVDVETNVTEGKGDAVVRHVRVRTFLLGIHRVGNCRRKRRNANGRSGSRCTTASSSRTVWMRTCGYTTRSPSTTGYSERCWFWAPSGSVSSRCGRPASGIERVLDARRFIFDVYCLGWWFTT